MTYELETTVHDGTISVSPDLEGKRVRIIVIPMDEPAQDASDNTGSAESAMKQLFAAAKPGIHFTPFTRGEAHKR